MQMITRNLKASLYLVVAINVSLSSQPIKEEEDVQMLSKKYPLRSLPGSGSEAGTSMYGVKYDITAKLGLFDILKFYYF